MRRLSLSDNNDIYLILGIDHGVAALTLYSPLSLSFHKCAYIPYCTNETENE